MVVDFPKNCSIENVTIFQIRVNFTAWCLQFHKALYLAIRKHRTQTNKIPKLASSQIKTLCKENMFISKLLAIVLLHALKVQRMCLNL